MKNCKYCDKPLPASDLKNGNISCANCRDKLPDVQRFVEVCDEFKEIIDYEGILRERRLEELKKEAAKR